MEQPQETGGDASTPAVQLEPWWKFWLPVVRTTNDKALDEATRPGDPRVGSWDEQKDRGAKWLLVEWIFRF